MNELHPMIVPVLIGILIGIIIVYALMKSARVPRKIYDDAVNRNKEMEGLLRQKESLIQQHTSQLQEIKSFLTNEQILNREQGEELARIRAERNSIEERLLEEKETNNKQQVHIDQHREEIINLKTTLGELTSLKSTLEERLQEQRQEQKEEREKALVEFENVTSRLLKQSTESLSQHNTEGLSSILNPLKENISEFKKQVADVYHKESKERFSLESSIKDLVQLNQQISQDANNLTNALKGQAKTQGDWGEMILENILEQSGLVKNREYFTQESYIDDQGKRKQPDVKIKYPDQRFILIDAKVSLNAYERYANADDPEEQKNQLALHIKSIRNHIDNLHSKGYDKYEKTLDFVMLFVPIEPAYMLAMHYDQELWNYAYKKKILLISPTNLIAALKMVADIWKREHQSANVLKIAERGTKLYEKFVGFVKDMEEIDKHLSKANASYASAMNKLSKGNGNLIGQAEKLKSMGIDTSKELPDKYKLE